MTEDPIQKILNSRRQDAQLAQPAPQDDSSKFFSILLGEGLHEHFLELRFSFGMRSCFNYNDLLWFNYDPDAGTIDLEFGGYLVTIKGRGLGDRLFQGLKQKRVAWVREADHEMQDDPANEAFVEKIMLTQPETSGEQQPEE